MIAHVGALNTRDSIELAQASERDGAAAVSMVPPIYYSYGIEEIIEHYEAVLDRTSLPMIIYNIRSSLARSSPPPRSPNCWPIRG